MPKLIFKNNPLKNEVSYIYYFLFHNNWGWNNYILKKHPRLKSIYKFEFKKERMQFLEVYIKNFNKANKAKIKNNSLKIQKNWKKIENEFLRVLEEIINTKFPAKRNPIAFISLNPICPRSIKDWTFTLYFNFKMGHAMEVIMHEITHFLYFKKWEELYPKMHKKKFDYPYIEWHLSEIMAPIILNDKRIQKLLKRKAGFYEEHSGLKIKNKNVPKFFSELYQKSRKENKNFDEFIKSAYKEIKINKSIFEKLK